LAEEGHVNGAREVSRHRVGNRGEHGRHRYVAPELDGSQRGFGSACCVGDFVVASDIRRNGNGSSTTPFDFARRRVESSRPASEERNVAAVARELDRRSAADTR